MEQYAKLVQLLYAFCVSCNKMLRPFQPVYQKNIRSSIFIIGL
jgi:hypothetical protein